MALSGFDRHTRGIQQAHAVLARSVPMKRRAPSFLAQSHSRREQARNGTKNRSTCQASENVGLLDRAPLCRCRESSFTILSVVRVAGW
jgi:hypothetical protein